MKSLCVPKESFVKGKQYSRIKVMHPLPWTNAISEGWFALENVEENVDAPRPSLSRDLVCLIQSQI
jgi:hypothetical protein